MKTLDNRFHIKFMQLEIGLFVGSRPFILSVRPGFHYTANATTTTQKQSD